MILWNVRTADGVVRWFLAAHSKLSWNGIGVHSLTLSTSMKTETELT